MRFSIRDLFWLTLVIALCLSLWLQYRSHHYTSAPDAHAVDLATAPLLPATAKEAVSTAASRIGLLKFDPNSVTVQTVMLTRQCLPFFPEWLEGRTAWAVEFTNLDLAKASGNPSLRNGFIKNLVVVLCPETGEVMRVASTWPKDVPRIGEHPPAAEEERQLRQSSESYVGFPSEQPRITLCDAISKSTPWGENVKQICACYVNRVGISHSSHPVWIVYLRGHGPMPFSIPAGLNGLKVEACDDAGNHLRNVVDAKTGKWLLADTVPQPISPLEKRY